MIIENSHGWKSTKKQHGMIESKSLRAGSAVPTAAAPALRCHLCLSLRQKVSLHAHAALRSLDDQSLVLFAQPHECRLVHFHGAYAVPCLEHTEIRNSRNIAVFSCLCQVARCAQRLSRAISNSM